MSKLELFFMWTGVVSISYILCRVSIFLLDRHIKKVTGIEELKWRFEKTEEFVRKIEAR